MSNLSNVTKSTKHASMRLDRLVRLKHLNSLTKFTPILGRFARRQMSLWGSIKGKIFKSLYLIKLEKLLCHTNILQKLKQQKF